MKSFSFFALYPLKAIVLAAVTVTLPGCLGNTANDTTAQTSTQSSSTQSSSTKSAALERPANLPLSESSTLTKATKAAVSSHTTATLRKATRTAAIAPIAAGEDNSNLLLGNPSQATTDPKQSPDNYLVERSQHTLSYNKSQGEANWVSWHLQKSDLGNIRRGNFWPDPLLPTDMQIRPNDYRGSGYDRGHICPSGDRTATREDNNATFVMSNMLPQAAALNQHVWKDLEDYSRYLANGGNELYTIAGGSGSAGRIAGGKVNVPALCWKIIVVLPLGDGDLTRIAADTRVIAVSMPNREMDEIKDSKWPQWITTVDQLEQTTGYDFLSALPDEVENVLEAKRDSGRAQRSDKGTARNTAPASGNEQQGSISQRNVFQRNVSQRNVSPISTLPVSGSHATTQNRTLKTNQSENQASATNQVWVNTRSGVYHYPGARWYGTTKQGEYMSERQALAQGYHAAQNGQ